MMKMMVIDGFFRYLTLEILKGIKVGMRFATGVRMVLLSSCLFLELFLLENDLLLLNIVELFF